VKDFVLIRANPSLLICCVSCLLTFEDLSACDSFEFILQKYPQSHENTGKEEVADI
jgi:hypothetical protein